MDKNLWYLDSTFWYLIAFCGVFLLSLLLCILSFAFPNPHNGFMRHIAYPVIIRRRNSWDSVTRLEFCLIAILFGINVVVILIPFGGIDWRQIERRAAFTAGVNAIPLCLGGRMGPIVQALNIPRSSYLLFHTWVGRIAVLEAASHAVIVLCLRPRLGPLVTSGWIAFGAFLAILMFSFWFARSRLGPFFLFSHRMFALTSIGALFWHALLLSEITTQILVAVCGVLWLTTTLIRLRKLLFHRLSGEIVEKLRGGDATKIEVALRYPVRVSPGNYFHIFFPTEGGHSYNYLHGYPVVACWHPPDTDNSSEELSHISFILSHSGGHSGAVHRLKAGARILLDGPLGQDLGLGSYETVILLAKGIGIAGVLPMALQLIERLQHDARVKDELQELSRLQQSILQEEKSCGPEEQAAITDRKREVNVKRASLSRKPLFRDATKKVILFWSLDNNSQMDWIADQFKALQKLDPENVRLAQLLHMPY
ncbi:NADPH oxidase [Fusarium albosuccineum]|uniref:NADPH oxidase n=1 Tax=Fusarium albosuccineum TaxID=1237068 RepID=A0A8H4LF15_9HYPO|nr:NADPH oxidase [Fusarium albosuccineum]